MGLAIYNRHLQEYPWRSDIAKPGLQAVPVRVRRFAIAGFVGSVISNHRKKWRSDIAKPGSQAFPARVRRFAIADFWVCRFAITGCKNTHDDQISPNPVFKQFPQGFGDLQSPVLQVQRFLIVVFMAI